MPHCVAENNDCCSLEFAERIRLATIYQHQCLVKHFVATQQVSGSNDVQLSGLLKFSGQSDNKYLNCSVETLAVNIKVVI